MSGALLPLFVAVPLLLSALLLIVGDRRVLHAVGLFGTLLLAIAGANVIEVLHTRHGQGLQISEVVLQLSVETRGADHRAHTIAVLEEAGFRPKIVED